MMSLGTAALVSPTSISRVGYQDAELCSSLRFEWLDEQVWNYSAAKFQASSDAVLSPAGADNMNLLRTRNSNC